MKITKEQLRTLIREEIKNNKIFIPSSNYLKSGVLNYDDKEFLKIVWHFDIDTLNKLVPLVEEDINNMKPMVARKSILRQLYKRELFFLNDRLKMIKQIIRNKIKDPNYIPSSYI